MALRAHMAHGPIGLIVPYFGVGGKAPGAPIDIMQGSGAASKAGVGRAITAVEQRAREAGVCKAHATV